MSKRRSPGRRGAEPSETELARVAKYSKANVAPRTRSGYAGDFARFAAWCKEKKLRALPTKPSIVAAYLAAMADGAVKVRWRDRGGEAHESQSKKTVGTINRALSAIVFTQREAGYEWPRAHPAIVQVMHGIARALGHDPRRVSPLEIDDLRACLILSPATLAGMRNKAMLSLGFFTAMRRSELVALTTKDVAFTDAGLLVQVRRSKTDQTGKGHERAVPGTKDARVCPVKLLKAWLAASGIESGPLFRRVDKAGNVGPNALSPQAVTNVIKHLVEVAGLDPRTFSGHSLRAGFVTSAAAKGKSLHNIMRQTGHRSEHVAMTYIRHATPWDQNAADGLA